MSRPSVIRLSIVSKAAMAVVAFAVALGAVATVAALATRGAARVEAESAERVEIDGGMRIAQDNNRLAHERMRATSAAEARRTDLELDASDARLAQAIGTSLAQHRDERARSRCVGTRVREYAAFAGRVAEGTSRCASRPAAATSSATSRSA